MQTHKDKSYWAVHKEVWDEEFNCLDVDIAKQIMQNPMGEEATSFEERVDRLIGEKENKIQV
tara:strand:+ start:1379 stop:1564 length:186 start_codon:yes stop_codon:yes gene_type:complete